MLDEEKGTQGPLAAQGAKCSQGLDSRPKKPDLRAAKYGVLDMREHRCAGEGLLRAVRSTSAKRRCAAGDMAGPAQTQPGSTLDKELRGCTERSRRLLRTAGFCCGGTVALC